MLSGAEPVITDARQDITWLDSKNRRGWPPTPEADSVEIHGEHLAFLRSDGELSALFLFEIVKDWSEVDPSNKVVDAYLYTGSARIAIL
jgi:hypothetical protein